jgi:hypothetical protein
LQLHLYYLLLILLLDGAFPDALFIPGLVVAAVVTIVGMAIMIWGSSWNGYILGIRRLPVIEPPEVVITKFYAVTKHMNTHVFVIKGAPMAIYLVALEGTNLRPAIKVDVPKTFWKWDSSVEHIEGHRVHKRTGVFSIPTPEPRIVSGEGVPHALPFLRMSPRMGCPNIGPCMAPVSGITRENILALAEVVSKPVSDSIS